MHDMKAGFLRNPAFMLFLGPGAYPGLQFP